MLGLTIKQLAARKARLATTTAAVVLGVTFLTGTLILTDSIDHTLDNILTDANAGTDAYVRRPSELDLGFGEPRARLDADLVDQIRTIDGVDTVAGSHQRIRPGPRRRRRPDRQRPASPRVRIELDRRRRTQRLRDRRRSASDR